MEQATSPNIGRLRASARLSGYGLCLVLLAAAGCGPVRGAGNSDDTLTIGAYSVVRDAFREKILPGFAAYWKQKTGRLVRFEESYNASGAQSRAIVSGFDADVAVLSLDGDIDRLVKAGIVDKNWKSGPGRGLITRSIVVIGIRPGNPASIDDWDDLTRPGVGVLYPDPKTSGGAKWNINAIYGAGLLEDPKQPDPAAARDLLSRVQTNVVNMDSSGRQSMATFERGTGDAIITYENELLLQDKRKGIKAPYVIPSATLQIEGPAAIVESSVKKHGNRAVAVAFLEYLRTEEAQRILADYGFRALDPKLDPPGRRPLPSRLFTMKDLGGWTKINKDVYGPSGVWDSLFTPSKGRTP
ncbi:sulfate ABC transporter substrate-binding protein [Singulisphaera sp. Ch08]|uniref:Sulfate ABC transporter substrate-binding protein n=1 Tax=Singulisphaera sp. Ch08 TaxID=3120278 RepID=A0AAU7CI39_9BACT